MTTEPPGEYISAIRTTRCVARYLFQILMGCGDPNCFQTYCKQNISLVFKGRHIGTNAAINLAMQLSALQGDRGLCVLLQSDNVPPYIFSCIDEKEPLKSPILGLGGAISLSQMNKEKSGGAKPKTPKRVTVPMWTNVKSVVPASTNGGAFLSTYSITPSKAQDIKKTIQALASTPWEHRRVSKRTGSEENELIKLIKDALRGLPRDQKLYLSRYIVNAINASLPLAIWPRVVTTEHHITTRSLSSLLYVIANENDPTTWQYLNFRVGRIFLKIGHNREDNSKILYEVLVATQMLKAWPIGLNVGQISIGSAISLLTDPRNLEILEFIKEHPGLAQYATMHKTKLPHIASAYFQSHLLQPLYRPAYNQGFRFLTLGSGFVFLPFQERVDLLRYVCLKYMNNCLQQAIANSTLASSLLKILYPVLLTELLDSLRLLGKIPYSFTVTVSRDNIIKDAMDALANSLHDWDIVHRPLKVQFGKSELAVDQGGVQVEFFNELGTKLMKNSAGFFERDNDSKLSWFSPGTGKKYPDYELIGMLCGLAVYNGCTISVDFPSVLYAMIQYRAKFVHAEVKDFPADIPSTFFTFKDLEETFPVIARSFTYMRNNPSKLKELDISCHFSYNDFRGKTVVYPIPSSDGSTKVTRKNMEHFIQEYIYAKLYTSVKSQFNAFYNGFLHFMPLSMLDIFSRQEFRTIVEGTQNISVLDLKAHTKYDGYVFRIGNSPSITSTAATGAPLSGSSSNDTGSGSSGSGSSGINTIGSVSANSSVDEDNSRPKSQLLNPATPENSQTVQYFWNVVEKFNQKELSELLEFVTGTNRIPSGGMAKLEFIVQRNGTDDERLPSSSVCFSRLLLPEYTSQKQLDKMLRLALKHSVGFGLI